MSISLRFRFALVFVAILFGLASKIFGSHSFQEDPVWQISLTIVGYFFSSVCLLVVIMSRSSVSKLLEVAPTLIGIGAIINVFAYKPIIERYTDYAITALLIGIVLVFLHKFFRKGIPSKYF